MNNAKAALSERYIVVITYILYQVLSIEIFPYCRRVEPHSNFIIIPRKMDKAWPKKKVFDGLGMQRYSVLVLVLVASI